MDNAANVTNIFKVMVECWEDYKNEEEMVGDQLGNLILGSLQQLFCFTHSLQLIVCDGFSEVSRVISQKRVKPKDG